MRISRLLVKNKGDNDNVPNELCRTWAYRVFVMNLTSTGPENSLQMKSILLSG